MPMRVAAPRPMRRPVENLKAPGVHVEGLRGIEVDGAGRDHGERRRHRADPQHHGQPSDRFDAAVEQRDVQKTDHHRDANRPAGRQSGPEVPRVVREPDVARRDFERPAEQELPDEQEGQEASDVRRAEALSQVAIRAAGARVHRAELAPDQAVGRDDHQRDEPARQRLRTAERRHQERDRDERPDPDHVRHVQRRRGQQPEAALEGRRRCHGERLQRSAECRVRKCGVQGPPHL